MIQPQTLVLVLGAVALSAFGQLALKSGVQHVAEVDPVAFLVAAARSLRVLSGLAAWAASAVCWLYVLRVTPLSRAYLLSSLTYVLVPLAGVHVFGERMRPLHAVGMVLILAGVACLMVGD